MSAQFVLSLDQGTTSSRSILFDHDGNVVSKAQQEFKQIFPRPGWVEHDAVEIWQTQLQTAHDALTKANVSAANISAIGITNQRETAVIWDRTTGQPIHNAIVWQDRRTAEYCDRLKNDAPCAALIQEKTGLVIDAYFSATKINWLLDQIPDARAKAEQGQLAFGTIDTWLAWNLSAGKLHITDPSNASRTLLCNIGMAKWDKDLLDLFDVPAAILPDIKSSSEIYGATVPDLFDGEIPIAGIAGDQQAALFGQACHHPGMAKNTYGTGCFLLMNTGTQRIHSKNNLLSTIAWQLGPDEDIHYALEGSVFIGGAVVQWLRDQLGIINNASEIEALAATVDSTEDVYLVPAFAGLGAPHWDGFARGTIQGLTRGTNKAHIARAALEAIAFQSAELLEAMERDSSVQLSELRVDGGASQNSLLMQFQSDLLNTPVVQSKVAETTALGAAYLAGLATNFWKDQNEITTKWAANKQFKPVSDQANLKRRQQRWTVAVERSKQWVDK